MSFPQLYIRSKPHNNLNSTICTIRDTRSYMTTSYTAKTAPSLLIAASKHFRFASVFLNPDRVVMTLTNASTPQKDVCFVPFCISPHTRFSSLSTDNSFVLFLSHLLNIHKHTPEMYSTKTRTPLPITIFTNFRTNHTSPKTSLT